MTTIQKFGTADNHIHTDEKVIVLIDEGHRTQYKFNAEAMRSAMPNAVFFAFTGTPIDKKSKSTYKVFGPLLDKYSFEESKEDGATLPILYEDRLPQVFVEGEDTIERVFAELDKDTKQALKKQYVTKEKISEAPARSDNYTETDSCNMPEPFLRDLDTSEELSDKSKSLSVRPLYGRQI